MPPASFLPCRLPPGRALVLGIVVGLVVLIAGPSAFPAWSQTALTQDAEATSTSASASAPIPPDTTGRYVVYGIPGLTIGDIDPATTPNLYALAAEGSLANLNVRTIGSATCPASGWLSFGAGARAEAGPPHDPDTDNPARCPSITAPTTRSEEDLAEAGAASASIPGFDAVKEPNQGTGYTVDYGMLSRLMREHAPAGPAGTRACVAAQGPGAAYAVADEDGEVGDYTDDAAASDCRLALVDLGAIGSRSWLFDPIPNYSYTVPVDYDRQTVVAEADRRLGEGLADLRENQDPGEPEPTVLVAGLGDSSGSPRLRAVLAAGPGFSPGTLSSASTRTAGLLQLTDLAPGLLSRLGVDSPSGITLDLTPSDAAVEDRLLDLETEATKAQTVHEGLSTFSLVLDIAFYVLVVLAGLLLSSVLLRRWAPRVRAVLAALVHRRRGGRTVASVTADPATPARTGWVHPVLGWVGLVLAAVPMGAFLAGLAPWARFPLPGLGLALSVLLGAGVMLGLALVPPWGRTWRGRVAVIALTTVLVIAVDLATGSRLQANSLLGYNPIVGGRYYGLGNQGAAIFIVSLFTVLGLTVSRLRAQGHRRLVLLVPAAVGLLAVFVSGNPSWGAKFGGTIATLAGLLVLLALVSRIRLSLVRLALIGIASLTVLLGIAFLDWLRPAGARSHFGTFFDQLVTGEAVQVVVRKLSANLRIIEVNPALAIVTPLAVVAILVFLRYLLHFPRFQGETRTARLLDHWQGRLPALFADEDVHSGFLAAVTGLGVGLVLTDSGIAVPSTGAMVLLPYLLALCADPRLGARPTVDPRTSAEVGRGTRP